MSQKARPHSTLEFPQNLFHGRFWPTFHVSHLKPYHNRSNTFPTWHDEYDRPAPVAHSETGTPMFTVDHILDHKPHGKGKFRFLIGFAGYPDSHNEFHLFDPANPSDWEAEWPLLQAYANNHPTLSLCKDWGIEVYYFLSSETRRRLMEPIV